MHPGIVWQAIYWLSLLALGVVTAILFRRQLYRRFPVFFSYTLVLFLIDISRLLAYRTTLITYFYVYWISDAAGTLFALLAVGELILRRLFPRFYTLRIYRYLFLAAGSVVALFTALTAYSSRPKILLSKLITVLHTGDFLLTATLFFLVGLMVVMGRLWGRYEFGIALGLGVNAAALLTTLAIFSKSVPTQRILRNIALFGEDAASLIWLITFWKPEQQVPVPTRPVSPEILQEARKWEETLKSSLGRKEDSD